MTQQSEVKSKAVELRESIMDRLSDHADPDPDEVEEKLLDLYTEYQVPWEEAERSVINSYIEDKEIDLSDLRGGGEDSEVLVNEPDEGEQWINIEVQVTELYDDNNESISQVGRVGDDSGECKFTTFEDSDQPELEVGESYRIEGAVTDEYQGQISIKLVSTTEVTPIDEDVEVGDNDVVISGVLTGISEDSGLVKRCPDEDCTRILDNGRCDEHGQVDGKQFDLRIKGDLDDGKQTFTVILDKEMTEGFTGLSLEEAKQQGKDALDLTVVRDDFREDFVGEYLTFEASPYRRYYMVNDFDEDVQTPSTDELLVRGRSI